MDDRLCNLMEPCATPEAPLCPLQEFTLKSAVWYGDEPVCQAEKFQNLPWIKKQKLIADLKLKADDGFFTLKMLNFIKVVGKNLKGADPSDKRAEANWFKDHTSSPRPKPAKPKKRLKKGPIVPRRKRMF